MQKLTLLVVLSILVGCSSAEPFHKIIVIPKMRVHLVEKVSQVPTQHPALGCAYCKKNPEIYIVTNKWDGKYYPIKTVSAHEWDHIMHCIDPEVAHPHRRR